MSKKSLLSESQIRQFMKLAKLEPLSPGFVEGLTESAEDLDEGRHDKDELEERGGVMMRDDDEEVDEGMRGMRDEDEMDEVRTGVGPTHDLTRPRRGHGRGTGVADGLEEQEEVEDMEVDAMDDAGDEMEMDAAEMEAPVEEPPADAGKMVSVDDFLSALERALEDAMGEEVEIDADEAELDAEEADVDAEEADVDAEEAADDMDMMEAEKIAETDEALMENITKRVAKRIIMEALKLEK
jgi:hypothetical protein